ncbi:hypothetical protein ENSA5_19360 [Enhygromyxa salina]|uniref:Lipoprotein n=1 Tax=Enhygromyxa salina TaxID=215803 RepID=A0A2S9YD04_9BACT|nr:hypothetical protein [Enhygromyxa salina]PRQ02997.1 hypothetical protein ENSA5_19360 [Enhygromyxa salina]
MRARVRSLPPAVCALLLALALTVSACSKDELVNETIDEVTELTNEMVSMIREGEDKKAAVAEARALFESRKAELEPKMLAVTEVRGFQVSDEAVTKISEGLRENSNNMSLVQLDLVMAAAKDPELDAALKELVAAHTALLHLK